MNFEAFKKLIETIQNINERSHTLYQLKIDLMDYDEDYQNVISTLMDAVFTEEGTDWIDWYLYERVSHNGEILKAYEKDGSEICHNIESLWETVKPYVKN